MWFLLSLFFVHLNPEPRSILGKWVQTGTLPLGWIVFRALSYSSEMERDHREPELALGEKLLKLDRDQQKYEIEAFIKGF